MASTTAVLNPSQYLQSGIIVFATGGLFSHADGAGFVLAENDSGERHHQNDWRPGQWHFLLYRIGFAMRGKFSACALLNIALFNQGRGGIHGQAQLR